MDRKILIADDEPGIRQLVRSMLAKDYTVLGATDGRQAIDIAREQKPDLILMDIMMPDMDGYTACLAIKSDPATEAIPVVMLTGVGHELNKKLSQRFGADDYITKPFRLQELQEVVNRLLPTP
jgi:CheY-like chemotaxis protein